MIFPHYFCWLSLDRYRAFTATKWYATTVSMAKAPRPLARLYNVAFDIIFAVLYCFRFANLWEDIAGAYRRARRC